MTSQDESNLFAPPTEDDAFVPVANQAGAPRPLATLGARFAGSILDGLIYMVPLLPIFLTAVLTGEEEVTALAGLGVMVFVAVAVIQIYLISTTGQSLGKKMVKTRIIREDGSAVDFVSGVLIRAWVMGLLGAIPLVGSLIQIADPLFIFGERRQCLHDRLAKTLVIDVSYEG